MIAPRLRRAAAGLLAVTFAAAPAAAREPLRAGVRGHYYTDNSGITVVTSAVAAEQPVTPAVSVLAQVVMDRIDVQRQVLDPGDPGAAAQLTGHHDTDAVTSASATAGGGGVAQKSRWEGTVAATLTRTRATTPWSARALVRAGTEPDYKTISGQLSGAVELNERNTTLSGQLGGGRDWIDPIEAPPGQQTRWPAAHGRITAGAGLAQVLSPAVVLSFGTGTTWQRGTLSNPYRRAAVLPHGALVGTLFPEVLPRQRLRFTGFAALSWHVARGTALHLQQGAYADTWEVFAAIPEVTVARELGASGLALVRYRYYWQSAAWFHESHYHGIDVRYMSGDPRLGGTRDHTVGAEVRWRLLPRTDGPDRLIAAAGYDLSVLRYPSLHTDRIVAHIPSLSVSGAF